MSINIENEYTGNEKDFLSEKDIRTIAENVIIGALKHEGCPYETSVELLITGDESIREMNGQFRGLDKSTDVLSFPMIDFDGPADFDGFDDREDLFDPDTGELILGDIVISADHCMAQAAEYGHGIVREFAFLIAHSMLHLMGYDHMEPDESAEMERRQEEILSGLDYVR